MNTKDANLKVAKYDGTCCFCGKPTKAGKSLHFFRVNKSDNPAAGAWRQSKNAHHDCYESNGREQNVRISTR